MPPVQRSTRINLQDFKSKFLKILGQVKFNQYWDVLAKYMRGKLTKAVLDQLVPSTIGKENVVLHNQFIRALYSNANNSEAPPPPPWMNDTSKPVKGIRRKPVVAPSPLSTSEEPAGPVSPVPVGMRANGDGAIPSSPRKGRSVLQNRKAKERPSPLGFHHRGEASTSQGGSVGDEETPRSLENGGLKMPDLSRPVQQFQNPAAEHSNLDQLTSLLAKRPRLVPSSGVAGNDAKAVLGHPKQEYEEEAEEENGEDPEEVEADGDGALLQANDRFVKPPFGIPFCIASVGAPRMAPFMGVVGSLTHTLLGDGLEDDCLEGCDLPDLEGMQRRMQQIAVTENGLQGVSTEAANLLNRAVDVYLKRLIKSAIELGRARRSSRQFVSKENGGVCEGRELRKDGLNGLASHKLMNGTLPVHTSLRDDIGVTGEASEDADKCGAVISALDFKVAMEVNPKLLGEEWPTLMEKIALRVFDQ